MRLTEELERVAATLADRRGPATKRAIAAQLAALRAAGSAQAALRVGELAPDFELPDIATGHPFSLARALDHGPVLLNFVRGFWCPYCNLQLRALAQAHAAMLAQGATLVALTAQPIEAALNGLAAHPLPYPLLYDAAAHVATLFGLAYPLECELASIYRMAGIPITHDPRGTPVLPLTASYVVGRDGVVTYAFLDVDHTRRADPAALLDALARLQT